MFSMKPHRKHDVGRWQIERERSQIRSLYPDPPAADPATIGDVVSDIIRQFDGACESWLTELAMAWGKVVGDPVAQHTRLGTFESACLTVYVDSSVWLNELSRFGTGQMMDNLRQHLGDDRIQKIRLRLDPEQKS